jgi:hypothetical protein
MQTEPPDTALHLTPAMDVAQLQETARERLRVQDAIYDAQIELNTLTERLSQLDAAITATLGEGHRVDAGTAWLVVVPAKRASQLVSRAGCERYREELLDIGIAQEVTSVRWPTIAQVRSWEPDLIAAGVDLDVVAPTPAAGPPRIEVVAKR